MRILTDVEVRKRYVNHPAPSTERVHCDEEGLFYIHPEANCIDLDYPPSLERLPFFVRYLATLGYDDWDFRGALLWITEWGVWNDHDEGFGYRVVEAMHRAAGQPVSFETGPGHLFRADELLEATGMLLQPMIFAWDAYYAPTWSYGNDQFFVRVSHDSFVSVVTLTREFYDKAFGLLTKLELNPQPGHDLNVRRFCRGAQGGSK